MDETISGPIRACHVCGNGAGSFGGHVEVSRRQKTDRYFLCGSCADIMAEAVESARKGDFRWGVRSYRIRMSGIEAA